MPPGQYQGFHVMLGHVPDDTDHLTFKSLQTYSNGDVVRWTDVPQAGQPAPDHPAPVLTLTAKSGEQPSAAATSPASPLGPAPSASSKSGSDTTARALAVGAIGAISVARAARRT